MTKNRDQQPLGEQSPMTNNQTVVVIDSHGEVVGKTYPKRAKGLIKKGRAEALTDNCIRLRDFRPQNLDFTEEIKMDVLNQNVINNNQDKTVDKSVETLWKAFTSKHEFILFEPHDWYRNPDVQWNNITERYMYQNPDGTMTEIYSLGDWNGHWSEICSELIPVDPDTDYTFVFWLNGGENDRNNEVCRLIAVYTDSQEQKIPDADWRRNYLFKLNRCGQNGGIRPIKTIDGWYLFAIDLPKPDKKFLQLRFAAQNAPMAVKKAEEPSAYENIPDRPDEFAEYRPQRHNIFFTDGWPADDPKVFGNQYSTGAIKRRLEKEKADKERFEEDKAEWKKLIEENITRLKESGYNGGTLRINGVTVSNISDLDSVNVDELAENFVKNYNDRLQRKKTEGLNFKSSDIHTSAGDFHEKWSGMLEKLKGLKNISGDFSTTNGKMFNFSDLADLAHDWEDTVRNTEAHEAEYDRLAKEAEAREAEYDRLAKEAEKRSGSMNLNIDLGEIADQVADNVDLDEIAQQIADNIDVDQIANIVADNLDIDGIAEQVADNIYLDDLANKIAERLDLTDLLKELLDK